MMSASFSFQHTLNIYFLTIVKGVEEGVGVGGQVEKNFRKNYTQKKPSFIRVKSHGFYKSLLQINFISFSSRKTFSLNLLLKSDFKRCLN